ncbi:MAG TPA: RNA-guided endonuclease TnpB family protein [Ktedonobacterales bacterium]|nr:RNA-guided endonuclease TnpB family protein [Ktedonobacterales bacterium]
MCHKAYKEKLRPTPFQERELEAILWRCRMLYTTALEQRITAWQRRHVSVSRFEQEAELKDIRADFPEYAAVHSYVLQDVLARLDKTYQAFFRRVQRGEGGKKACFPRFKGQSRFRSFTYTEYGNGARLENGRLVRSKIGRIAVHWSRPVEGTPKTVTISKEADGWYVSFSCAEVPAQPLPPSGQETGIDLGLESFASLADGMRILTPGYYRRVERYLAKCQRRVARRKKDSNRRRKAVCWLAKAHQTVRRQRQDFHHKTAQSLVRNYDTIYHEGLQVANMVRNHHLATSISDAGWRARNALLSFKAAKTLGDQSSRLILRSRARCALAAVSLSGRACPSAGTPARTAAPACSAITTQRRTSNGAGSALVNAPGCRRGRTENPLGFNPCGVSGGAYLPAAVDGTRRADHGHVYGMKTGLRFLGGSSTMGKPIILAAETDQAVADALERDLQRRYGADYETLVERSPATGLERLRANQNQGQGGGAEVALLIAGLWMPEMSGIDFLVRAHALAPDAKRLLLIAFADPSANEAAATAATLAQFESFVTKPWASPEEWLYPEISQLLGEWAKGHLPRFEAVRIVGAQWSADTHLLRDLLERNPVSYGFYADDSPAGQQLLAEFHLDPSQLPAAILNEGRVMARPSLIALAEALGAHLQPQPQPWVHDVVIVGAGPAGLAAAVYGASEGLSTVAIEAEAVGGQAGTTSMIRNYLGFDRGVSGHDLTLQAYRQSILFGADIVFMNTATGLRAEGDTHVVAIANGNEVRSRAVVIATGVSYRRLGVSPIEALLGKGVYYGAALAEAPAMRGRRVFVAGAGNSAGQAAIYLAKFAQQVTILVRGDALAKSMSDYLVKQIDGTPNIDVRLTTQVVNAHGSERLERLALRNSATGGTETVAADGLFALIGADPHTDWLAGTVMRDERGFILTGHDLLGAGGKPSAGWPLIRPPYHLETSVPGVFAVGDVRSGSMKRVASAVGEGATAIALIHQYVSGQ